MIAPCSFQSPRPSLPRPHRPDSGRSRPARIAALALAAGARIALAGCGGDGPADPPGGTAACTTTPVPGLGTLQDFCPPTAPGGGGILFTASGEVLALGGYRFPPATADDVAFVDGWDVTYDRVLTTFDHITLSSGPDKAPTDQSQCDDGHGGAITCGTGGAVVAQVDGPFAVDLHKGGPLAGAGGGDEQAIAVAALTRQNARGDAAFDPATRYAFGFAVVPAATTAHNVNLDAADLADYQEMIARGYTTLLVGTAVWKGNAGGNLAAGGCTQTTVVPGYDFAVLPRTVRFRFGLTAPTVYRNAQNPANDPAAPLGGEEHQRGVAIVANQATTAQLTFHLDHVFWESFVHDSPAHFDPFAAKLAGVTDPPTLTLEDFRGARLDPFVDAQGHQVPWRSCLPATSYTPPGSGAMTFDTLGVPINPAGDPASAIRDFYDYTLYNHSTFGHLNSDGLTFVDRAYPSPP
jgi:hypothetical protein